MPHSPRALLLARTAVGMGIALAVGSSCTSSGSPLASSGDDVAGAGGNGGANAGKGGAAGAAGGAARGGAAGGSLIPSGGSAGGGGGGVKAGNGGNAGETAVVFIEPPGPAELRFLNGLADVRDARLCLVRSVDGVDAPGPEIPLPSAEPLVYGASTPIDLTSLGETARHPYILSGGPASFGAATCAELLASPPAGVVVRGLPVLPLGTLTAPRSLLLAATGCLTGGGFPDPKSLCGSSFTAPGGNASAIVVELSRVLPQGLLSVQLVHASRANEAVNLAALSAETGEETRLATNVSYGGVAPRPPYRSSRSNIFGTVPDQAAFLLSSPNSLPLSSLPYAETILASGLALDDVTDDTGVVFVLVGPRFPQQGSGGGGAPQSPYPNQPRLVVLKAPNTAL